jgi:hypothetical protein
LILAFYSTAAALVYLALTGNWHFSLDDVVVGGTALLTALGTATGRYELDKFMHNLMQPKDPAPVVEPVVVEPVPATE